MSDTSRMMVFINADNGKRFAKCVGEIDALEKASNLTTIIKFED